MASPFSHSLSAVVVRSRPLVQLVSSSFLATYHTLFLQWQKIFLVIFIVELLKFPCLLRWVCGGVVDRQWVIARPPWCYHIDLLHILSLIKYTFGDLFGTCWLFVIANISPSFLHPLLRVAIVKPSGGGGGRLIYATQNLMFWWTGHDFDQMIGSPFSTYSPPPVILGGISLVCFCVKMNTSFWKSLNFELNSFIVSL